MLPATETFITTDASDTWRSERDQLLGKRISDLGLSIHGSSLERVVKQLYEELRERGLAFRPPVYLSDEWGCPDGTPLIGVPFYLADARLCRLEKELSAHVECEAEMLQYLRHEAGHAFNYAYRLHDRPGWTELFGEYSRPYRDRYEADPFSRDHVCHLAGWYAQKHPDEDLAETFAVWLTPDTDWRAEYSDWPVARRKLEYVDALMRSLGDELPPVPMPAPEHLPIEALTYTVGEHYRRLCHTDQNREASATHDLAEGTALRLLR